jgi:hypothetical protein
MRRFTILSALVALVLITGVAMAQEDGFALKNWNAPQYWQPRASVKEVGPDVQMFASTQGMTAQVLSVASAPVPFVAITPCRIVDTRVAVSDGFHQPNFADNETRTFDFPASPDCPGLPMTAVAYSLNVQFRPISVASYITLFPTGTTMPLVSTLTASPAAWVQNSAIVAAGTNGQVDVYCQFAGRVVIDINGYYAPQNVVGTIFSNTFFVTGFALDTFLPLGGAGTPSGGELVNSVPIPAACTADVLSVLADTANGTGDVTFTLRVNGSNSSLGCTVLSAATGCTASGSVGLLAGDRVVIGVTGPATYGSANSIGLSLRCR